MKFWDWQEASEDTGGRAVLVLSGVIDTGASWYEDTTWPGKFREELAAHAGEPVTVEINSPGGDVFAGFEIYNLLTAHEGSVRVRVVGLCASAASLVAMAADAGELIMSEASMMMIHNPWTCSAGNSGDLRDAADVLDLIGDVMVSVYMHRWHGSEEELRKALDEETPMTPARAMELGLCDSVETRLGDSGDQQAAAAALLGRYAACLRGPARAAIRARSDAMLAPERRRRAASARRAYSGTPVDAAAMLREADELIARMM